MNVWLLLQRATIVVALVAVLFGLLLLALDPWADWQEERAYSRIDPVQPSRPYDWAVDDSGMATWKEVGE